MSENATINVKNKSHSITAEVTVPVEGAEGVIVSQGGAYAGWSLYLKEGRPTYCYNLFGLQRFHVRGDTPVPAGTHQVRMEFGYDGGGLGKGGSVSLYVDGAKRGQLSLSETEFRQVGYEANDMSWLLPEVSLNGVTPRRGDAIEDASGTYWTILSATKSPLSGVWRAVTRRQV